MLSIFKTTVLNILQRIICIFTSSNGHSNRETHWACSLLWKSFIEPAVFIYFFAIVLFQLHWLSTAYQHWLGRLLWCCYASNKVMLLFNHFVFVVLNFQRIPVCLFLSTAIFKIVAWFFLFELTNSLLHAINILGATCTISSIVEIRTETFIFVKARTWRTFYSCLWWLCYLGSLDLTVYCQHSCTTIIHSYYCGCWIVVLGLRMSLVHLSLQPKQ